MSFCSGYYRIIGCLTCICLADKQISRPDPYEEPLFKKSRELDQAQDSILVVRVNEKIINYYCA